MNYWKERLHTLLFLLTITAAVVGYDLVAEFYWGDVATISKVLLWVNLHAGTFSYAVVFWVGVIVGHVFFYQTLPADQR